MIPCMATPDEEMEYALDTEEMWPAVSVEACSFEDRVIAEVRMTHAYEGEAVLAVAGADDGNADVEDMVQVVAASAMAEEHHWGYAVMVYPVVRMVSAVAVAVAL